MHTGRCAIFSFWSPDDIVRSKSRLVFIRNIFYALTLVIMKLFNGSKIRIAHVYLHIYTYIINRIKLKRSFMEVNFIKGYITCHQDPQGLATPALYGGKTLLTTVRCIIECYSALALIVPSHCCIDISISSDMYKYRDTLCCMYIVQ